LGRIESAGAQITEIDVAEFVEIESAAMIATFPAVEAFALHRELLKRHKGRYDPRVAVRIARGEAISAADYL
jgi:Asp-tRNA(Asn)/Glu-tRNA(Gln) amidotransferase A subunit family amidase